MRSDVRRRIRRAAVLAGAAAAMFAGCTRPPRSGTDDIDLFTKLLNVARPVKFKAAGEVTIATDGERHAGYADVRFDSSSAFRATFYSPLGAPIGTVRASADSAYVDLEGKRHAFSLDQTMETLPYAWGHELSFREFVDVLVGRVPVEAGIITTPPHSISSAGRFRAARWQTDSVSVEARVNRRTEQVERLVLTHRESWGTWVLTMGSFRDGLARSISLSQDDRNYFSVQYDRVVAQ